MNENKVNISTKELDRIVKMLKGKLPVGRIGILGSSARKSGGSNAEIGAAHEFGTVNMSPRSFLRVPLKERLFTALKRSGAYNKETLKDVVKTGSLLPWMSKTMIVAEGVVQGAFDTKGYGDWPGWKDPNYMNNSGMVLVDTTQLRDSITSEVKA